MIHGFQNEYFMRSFDNSFRNNMPTVGNTDFKDIGCISALREGLPILYSMYFDNFQ